MSTITFDGLLPEQLDAVERLLKEANNERDGHYIVVNRLPPHSPSFGEWTYGVGFKSKRAMGITPPRLHHNIRQILIDKGAAQIFSAGESKTFSFTDEAFDLYEKRIAPSHAELRKEIGTVLYEEVLEGSAHGLETAELSAKSKVDQNQVVRRIKVLTKLELVEEIHNLGVMVGSTNPKQEPVWIAEPSATRYKLTAEGVRWAAAGYPEISYGQSSSFRFTFNFTLPQAVQQVEALSISEEDKAKFERILRRFEEESNKEDPSYRPLQDGLDMMTKLKELLPVGIRFFSQHLDSIERMAKNIPGV